MDDSSPLYLDYASTTPVDPLVLDAMLPFFTEGFGNASSKDHPYGDVAKNAITVAREQVANLINADPKEIIFTSGATEAINIALIGFYLANKRKGRHILTVGTEHKAVLNTIQYLESIGAAVTYLEVDKSGLMDIDQFSDYIRDDTILASVMFVNNETGVIQNIIDIARICNNEGIVIFSDTSQAVGKIEIDVQKKPIDLLCMSGHKIHGPKGVGVLYLRDGIRLQRIIYGGGQENGIRPGTYNTPLIVGIGEACRIAAESIRKNYKLVETFRDIIEDYFEDNNLGVVISKHVKRSPYISSILLNGITSEEFILKNRKNISISSGSACNSEIIEPSHVIMEMLHEKQLAEHVIRLSYSSKSSFKEFKNIKILN